MNLDIYNRNMKALEEKSPFLATKIKNNVIEENRYKIIRAKTGEPNLLVASNDGFIMLYDNAMPYEDCKRYFEGLNISYAPIVIFMGFGLGYHLHMFVHLYADKVQVKKIIVFEKDINFLHLAINMIDLSQVIMHPNIHFFVGEAPADVFPRLRKDILTVEGIPSHVRSTKIIPLPAHIMLNDQYYRETLEMTRKAFRQLMILAGNDPTDAYIGMDNLLSNVRNIVSNPGINQLKDKFKGRPAITVATGPSLEKNMHLLRDIRDRALIISCDASFLPLMKRDIRPHMVVSLERTDGTEYFFESVPDFDGIYLAICPLVRPRAFDSYNGKKIIVHRTFSHFDWLHLDKGALSIGPAVSNMAFKIAEYLGCDPIIMIGQDLAFAEDGDTHAKDMPFGERDELYHTAVLEVEGNDGRPVKTSRAWEIFKIHHEEDISSYTGLCINATEGGAKIRGTILMTFHAAIEKYCNKIFSSESIIAESMTDFEMSLDISKELHSLLDRSIETRLGLENTLIIFSDYQKEICNIHKNMILPFMREGGSVDSEYLLSVAKKFLGIMDTYLTDQNINDIMLHTVQPHLVWFHNKFNYLSEIYSNEDFLRSAQILMIKDWLGVIGQLFVSTIDSLERTEKMITAELEEEQKIA